MASVTTTTTATVLREFSPEQRIPKTRTIPAANARKPPNNDDALKLLHGIRGLAHIWVASFHAFMYAGVVFQGAKVFHFWTTGRTVFNVALLDLIIAGNFGVDWLFMLSGFFAARSFTSLQAKLAKKADGATINNNNKGVPESSFNRTTRLLKEFYVNRFLRLLPGLYFGLAFWFCILGPSVGLPHLPWIGIFRDMIMWGNVGRTEDGFLGVAWSLAMDWQCYLLSPLILWGIQRVLRSTDTQKQTRIYIWAPLLAAGLALVQIAIRYSVSLARLKHEDQCQQIAFAKFVAVNPADQDPVAQEYMFAIGRVQFETSYRDAYTRGFPFIAGIILFVEWVSRRNVESAPTKPNAPIPNPSPIAWPIYIASVAILAHTAYLLQTIPNLPTPSASSCLWWVSLTYPVHSLAAYFLARRLLFTSPPPTSTSTPPATSPPSLGRRLLNSPFLSSVADVSYASYLLHWPILMILYTIIAEVQEMLGASFGNLSVGFLVFATVCDLAVSLPFARWVNVNVEVPFARRWRWRGVEKKNA